MSAVIGTHLYGDAQIIFNLLNKSVGGHAFQHFVSLLLVLVGRQTHLLYRIMVRLKIHTIFFSDLH